MIETLYKFNFEIKFKFSEMHYLLNIKIKYDFVEFGRRRVIKRWAQSSCGNQVI